MTPEPETSNAQAAVEASFAELNRSLLKATASGHESLEAYREAGQALIRLKEILPHGRFIKEVGARYTHRPRPNDDPEIPNLKSENVMPDSILASDSPQPRPNGHDNSVDQHGLDELLDALRKRQQTQPDYSQAGGHPVGAYSDSPSTEAEPPYRRRRRTRHAMIWQSSPLCFDRNGSHG
jgi:hypothetical protein